MSYTVIRFLVARGMAAAGEDLRSPSASSSAALLVGTPGLAAAESRSATVDRHPGIRSPHRTVEKMATVAAS